jgi:peptide deformylase
MVLNIAEYPNVVLKRTAAKVKRGDTPSLATFIDDMIETMVAAHGIGLAAPQVGLSKRLLVADLNGDRRAFLNPRIVRGGGNVVDEEGCLSFPGLYGMVARYEKVTVAYQDAALRSYVDEFEGLNARVLQHEIDHLNGVLILDRAEDHYLYEKAVIEEEEGKAAPSHVREL